MKLIRLRVRFKRGVFWRIVHSLRDIAKSLRVIAGTAAPSRITVVAEGVTFYITSQISVTSPATLGEDMNSRTVTLPNDQEDFPYTLPPVTDVTDAEGETITGFTESFETSDVGVAQPLPTDDHSGSVHVGRSGVATLTRYITVGAGRNKVKTAFDVTTFNITTGLPVTVNAPGVEFGGGVTADPVEPPVEPTV